MKKRLAKTILFIISVAGWFALVTQFYLIIENRITSITETIIRYFSFYTILTNILVAYCATILLLKPTNSFFSKQATLTAITIYIVIVGLVYNVVLRRIWNPEGLQMAVDELLHTIIPVLFLSFWLVFVSKNELKWKNILSWMIYPLVYLIYILIRGKLSGFYPYPFVDVSNLGFTKVLLNSGILLIVFLVFSFLFVGIGKLMKSRNK